MLAREAKSHNICKEEENSEYTEKVVEKTEPITETLQKKNLSKLNLVKKLRIHGLD